MRHDVIGRALRALRHRKGWRQADLSSFSGVARSVISDLEAGILDLHAIGALERVAEAVGGTLRLDLRVPGGDLGRLLDADHARLQARWVAWLGRHGWATDVEATFNHYGERGSVDVLAWHPRSGVLLVVEVKTVLVDIQATLAALDRKTRIARELAGTRGWRARCVVPALFVLDGTTARRRLGDHAALFARYALRGWAALAWLRAPQLEGRPPTGILCFTKVPPARSGDRRRAGRQRIRAARGSPRSAVGLRPVERGRSGA